jgi:hypothetical protein
VLAKCRTQVLAIGLLSKLYASYWTADAGEDSNDCPNGKPPNVNLSSIDLLHSGP